MNTASKLCFARICARSFHEREMIEDVAMSAG